MGAIAYSASVAHRDLAGAVTVHPQFNRSEDEAANHVVEIVRETLASAEFTSDDSRRIAILVRSRTAAGPIFDALQRADIASLSIDMDALGEQAVVMDLVTLTLALRFPHSRLHWLALLRAPWCGLTLHDLHAITFDDQYIRALPLLLSDTERLERLSTDGQQRIKRLLAIMQPAIEQAPRTSVVSWVEAVWLQLGGPTLCTRAVDKDAAERCLSTLYDLEAQGKLWQPQAINDAMARLFAATPDDGSAKVHVMTMHKAKGLEFDTVIVPSLNRGSNRSDTALLDWTLFDASGDGQFGLLLAPMSERNAAAGERSLGSLIRNLKRNTEQQATTPCRNG